MVIDNGRKKKQEPLLESESTISWVLQTDSRFIRYTNPQWREKLEQITSLIEEVRRRFIELYGLNEMLFHLRGPRHIHHRDMEMFMKGFRGDRDLGNWMDEKRQEAIEIMNSLLDEVRMQPLRGLREH